MKESLQKKKSSGNQKSQTADPFGNRDFLTQKFPTPKSERLGEPLPLSKIANAEMVKNFIANVNKVLERVHTESEAKPVEGLLIPYKATLELRQVAPGLTDLKQLRTAEKGFSIVQLYPHVDKNAKTTLSLLPLLSAIENSISLVSPERLLSKSNEWQTFKWKTLGMDLRVNIGPTAEDNPRCPVTMRVDYILGKDTLTIGYSNHKDLQSLHDALASLKNNGALPDSFGMQQDSKTGKLTVVPKGLGVPRTADDKPITTLVIFPNSGSEEPRQLSSLEDALKNSIKF